MQTQQTEAAVKLDSSRRGRWRFIAGAVLVILVEGVAILLLWPSTQPLTASEQQLVGMWTLPIGPNPPPNAVRQLFWLQADRTLKLGHTPVDAHVPTFRMTGTWRLEGEHLVMNARGHEKAGEALARAFGQAPNPPEMADRLRILRREDGVLFIEANDGSEATFVRLSE